jgi:nitroreductase/NAD-dependent dihydropyrimidine dehydrogenase PreA subunit
VSIFTVDADKCSHDGICVAVCPYNIIELRDKGDVPTPVAEKEALCLRCGHCEAFCPHGALTLNDRPFKQVEPIRDELKVTPGQTGQLMRSRRSIRHYKSQPVERQTLQQLLDIARHAPSGMNGQPVHWLVIYDTQELRRLAGLAIDGMRQLVKDNSPLAEMMQFTSMISAWEKGEDAICRNAPHLIVAHAHQKIMSAPTDCVIALTYLELAAPTFGLGVCWAGHFRIAVNAWAPLREALELPPEHAMYGAMMIGRPRYRYQQIPERKEARVTWR